MATAIFLLGASIVVAGYWFRNPYVFAGGGACQLLLWRPIDAILKLRRDNLILQMLPTLVSGLPPEKMAAEVSRLLRHLRSKA